MDSLEANIRCLLELATVDRTQVRRELQAVTRALRAQPRSSELHALRGRLFSHLGRQQAARESLEESLRLNPSSGRARAWLGESHLLETRFAEAARELSAGLKLAPENSWAVFHRAAARYALRRHADARRDLARLIDGPRGGEPRLAAVLFASLLDMESCRYPEALRGIGEVMRARPEDHWPHALRARIHRLMGRLDSAQKDLSLSFNGKTPVWVFEERASLHDARGQSTEALEDLRRVLRYQPARPDIQLRVFQLERLQGRKKSAAAAFASALSLPGGVEQARGLLFEISKTVNTPEQARELADLTESWLARRRNDFQVVQLKEHLKTRLKEWEMKTKEGRPGFAAARGERVNQLSQQGRLKQAEAMIRSDLAAGRRWKGAQGALADILIRSGQRKKAEAFLGRMGKDAARDPRILMARAELLLSEGQAPAALSLCRKAARLDPDYLRARACWAELELKAGRWPAARRALGSGLVPTGGAGAVPAWDIRERFRASLLRCDLESAVVWAERLLDGPVTPGDIDLLRRPLLMSDFEYFESPAGYRLSLRRAVETLARSSPRSPWGAYYRLVLGIMAPRTLGPASDLRVIQAASPRRYGWMRYEVGIFLAEFDLAAAEKEFIVAAGFGAVPDWRSFCRIAEMRLCSGHEAGSRKALALAERHVLAADHKDFLAWKGEILLWAGRYREALSCSRSALKSGAELAACWLGGALVCLGRWKQALAVLEKPGSARPEDREIRLWKAEALYRLGRWREALAVLPSQQGLLARDIYAAALSGLCRRGQGDLSAPREEFSRLDDRLTGFLRRKTGILGSSHEEFARLLEALLTLSRGVRRNNYEIHAWMR